jgi:phosphoribosyl-AMP cyclohydrolase
MYLVKEAYEVKGKDTSNSMLRVAKFSNLTQVFIIKNKDKLKLVVRRSVNRFNDLRCHEDEDSCFTRNMLIQLIIVEKEHRLLLN